MARQPQNDECRPAFPCDLWNAAQDGRRRKRSIRLRTLAIPEAVPLRSLRVTGGEAYSRSRSRSVRCRAAARKPSTRNRRRMPYPAWRLGWSAPNNRARQKAASTTTVVDRRPPQCDLGQGTPCGTPRDCNNLTPLGSILKCSRSRLPDHGGRFGIYLGGMR